MNQLHRRRLIRNSVAALSCACFPGAFAATTSTAGNNCEPLGAPPRRRPQQAISLKALQARVSACKKAEACPKEAQSLYGLTRIDGFVVDRENHDIVLLGAQAQDEPPLHLDDFLVALRNLHGRYPGLGVGEGVLTYPAISLDPLPDTMVQLKQLGEELSRAKLGPGFDDILSRWHRTCLAPQQVRIMGIPRDAHFARIMVQGDYIIKRVADGDANLKIDRFQSLMDRNLGQAIDDIQSGRLAAALSLTRFWLTPGTRTYSSSERSVLIGTCRVQLLQEEQLLTPTGQLTAGEGGNELAARFACNFSRRYPDIAVADPLYRDLENLYRWMTVARLIIDSQAIERSGLSLRVLIERFPLRAYSMPLTLPGHSTVGNHDGKTDQMRYFIRLPTCGGIELPFEVGSVLSEAPKPRILADISERTLGSRPTPETAVWSLRE